MTVLSDIDLGRLDRSRRPRPVTTSRAGLAIGTKEWHHVVIHHPEMSLLVNISETVDAHGATTCRALSMASLDNSWHHEVLTAAPGTVSIDSLTLDVRLGDQARFWWDRDRYRLHVNGSRVMVDVTLRPRSAPHLLPGAVLSAHERISWVIVPRLHATGEVCVEGRRFSLDDAPAYHDHNWGHFEWGGNFSWEWIAITAEDWSLTGSRLLDRTRSIVSAHHLLIEDDHGAVSFGNSEVRVSSAGRLGAVPAAVVPGALRLLAPTSIDDIPRDMTWHARRGISSVTATLHPRSVARIVMPSDVRVDDVVVLAEAFADGNVDATIDGRPRQATGYGLVELVR